MIEKRVLKDSDAVVVINDMLKDYVLNLRIRPRKNPCERGRGWILISSTLRLLVKLKEKNST